MQSITISDGTNAFTFDQVAPGALIQELNGWEFFAVRSVIEDLPGRDGAAFITSKAGRRQPSWSGVIIGSSRTDWLSRRRELERVLTPGALKTITFTTDDGLSLQFQADVIGHLSPMTSRFYSHGPYLIEAVAPDFRFYSQTLTSSTTGVTSSAGGVSLPTALPASFATVTGSPRLTVTNNGNVVTEPTFRLTGPGSGFVVQNVTTGRQFAYNATLATGETVDIDVSRRTVLKAGSTNDYGNFSGDWWDLPPGESEIHFNATSGSSSSTLLRVESRDAYNSI